MTELLNNNFLEKIFKDSQTTIESQKNDRFIEAIKLAGYSFELTTDFEAFCRKRLQEVFSVEAPEFKTLWLDYGTENEKVICTYWDRYDFEYKFDGDKHSVTITWGQPPTPSHKPAQ